MKLDDCSKHEATILAAIVVLAKQLPYELMTYTRAVGEISRYFKDRGVPHHRIHNPSPGSVARVKGVRATEPWK